LGEARRARRELDARNDLHPFSRPIISWDSGRRACTCQTSFLSLTLPTRSRSCLPAAVPSCYVTRSPVRLISFTSPSTESHPRTCWADSAYSVFSLRLFLSPFFTVHVAIQYLKAYPANIGITHYLTSRLRLMPTRDVEFYWPELWSVHTPCSDAQPFLPSALALCAICAQRM
jgi:hypothetical protein